MIISTAVFRELKKRLPKAEISVISGGGSAEFISQNKNISNIYIYKRNLFKIFALGLRLRKEKFELFIDFDEENTLQTILLLWLLSPKFAFGVNRNNFKMYNIKAEFDFKHSHITDVHKLCFKTLGLINKNEEFNTAYDVFIPKSAELAAKKFLAALPPGRKNIIFNPFAASKHRCLSFAQLLITARHFSEYNIIVIGKAQELNRFLGSKKAKANIFFSNNLALDFGVFAPLALIKYGDILITPDTYAVHAACALKKPIYAIYPINQNKLFWPLGKNHTIVNWNSDFCDFDINILLDKIKFS